MFEKSRWRKAWFELCLVALGLASFAAVGPLRGALEAAPGALAAATTILFMIPGALATRWLLGGYFSGVALIPVAATVGVGVFALLGAPFLILQSSLESYLWAAGLLVAACILAAVVSTRSGARGFTTSGPRFGRGGVMWAPFAALLGACAYAAQMNAPSSFGDIWVYLGWIREYLSAERLAYTEPFFSEEVGLSRARINGWLLEQAAFSRVSGIEPVDLLFSYMNPALVVVALLAFYALARVLFENERAALFCGCLYALFFLSDFDASRLTFGGEFFQRLVEDKLAAKFLFLPVALGFAAAYLKGGGKAYFWFFTFACAAVVLVHPIGLAIIGISMTGLAVFHLASHPRSRAAWGRVSALGFAGLSIIAVPATLSLAATGQGLTDVLADSDINSGDPAVLRNIIFVVGRDRIFEFSDGSYMMHPSLLLHPVIAAAFLVGLPLLLPRVRRSLAAQLLFGMLLVTTLLVYVPAVATFMGESVVLPGQIWRLAWPIPLAAVLTLGWMIWGALHRAESWLAGRSPYARRGHWRGLVGALPVLVVAVLGVASLPGFASGAESVRAHAESARASGVYPADPIYGWLAAEAETDNGSKAALPEVVLAPDVPGSRIPAFSSEADVVSRRGSLVLGVLPQLEQRVDRPIRVPEGSRDVQEFFDGTTYQRAYEILRQNEADYVMVPSGSSLSSSIADLEGLERLQEPSPRYDVYGVDQSALPRI